MPECFKILTCNVRCIAPEDGKNQWSHRKDLCLDVMRKQNADIICTQELTKPQEDDVSTGLCDYDSFGLPDEALGQNCVNRVFFRRDRFKLIASGGYWLSETPHVAGSRSWGSNYIRLANWLRLWDSITDQEFRIVNTHLECWENGQTAREGQARCITEDTNAYPDDYPQILTGDMNCNVTNPAIKTFKENGWRDTYEAVHGTGNPGDTYHGFRGPDNDDNGKIDWIFVRGNIECHDAKLITDSLDGRYPSDHYFLGTVISLGQ